MDLYKELGVEKNSSQDDIKKAYKKLAMKHHPDRGGDAAKLSKINEAYNILKDPKKRAEYDNPRPNFGFSGHHSNIDDIFDEMFKKGGFDFRHGRSRQPENRRVQVRTTITLKECFSGKSFTASLQLPSGRIQEVDVNIPPGVTNGDMVHIRGMGDDSYKDLPRGDVYIEVVVKPEPGWDIHNYDIMTSVDVNVFELMYGTTVEIKTPENKKVNLKIPHGTQVGTVLSIKGYGLPNPRSKGRGNVHVKINSFIPTIESEKIIEELKGIQDEISKVSE